MWAARRATVYKEKIHLEDSFQKATAITPQVKIYYLRG